MYLKTQQNDAVDSEEDCRSKYISRKLFCKVAAESSLHQRYDATVTSSTTPQSNSGPFKHFCDDSRPTNILIDKGMHITAVAVWELTYAAAAGYTYSSPWWLLLELPEEWPR